METKITLTPDELAALFPLEEQLRRATQFGYIYCSRPKEDAVVHAIMEAHGKSYSCASCPNVIYQMYRQCGEAYYYTKNLKQEDDGKVTKRRQAKAKQPRLQQRKAE